MKHFLKSVVVATFIGFIGIQPICAQTGEEADLTSLLNEGRYPVTFANDATHPWTIFDDRIATIGNMENRDKVSSLSFRIDSMSVPTGEGEADMSSLLNEGSYPVTFTNDATYPWTISDDGIATNGNIGNIKTVSSLSFSYESDYQTVVGFSWRNNFYWTYGTFLNLYVDGVSMGNTKSDWTRIRFCLPKGKHVVELRDSITDSSGENFGQVQDIMVREIKELELSALSTDSKPLTFSNNVNYPWITEEGYISSSNYGNRFSSSKFSTTVSVEKPSMLSFEHAQSGPWDWCPECHQLKFTINGIPYGTYGGNSNSFSLTGVVLQPGEYQLEWIDSIPDRTEEWQSKIKNIRLTDNWSTIAVSTPGTLGIEVLYNFNILNDVELLAVEGTINGTDWAAIKQMNNLTGLDLSAAKFNSVPDFAFDGLSRLSYVKLPEGMTTIGQYAFRGTQLWDIAIPSSVTFIGECAFASTRVRTVKFKDDSHLQAIGYSAFGGCTSLQEFFMPSSVKVLQSYGNYSNVDYESNTFRDCISLKTLSFSDSLSIIPHATCYNCKSLKDVHLPKQLKSIYNNAFDLTSLLHRIDLPESLQYLGYAAFGSSAIDSISLPVKLSSMSHYSFPNCDNLRYVELPSYMPSYDNTFNDCNNIKTIVCKSATPPSITYDPFTSCPSKSGITLYVPSFAVANYKLDPYWYQFGSIQEMDVDLDYWRVSGNLMLTNNRRMNGKPDVDLYYGSQTTVGGNAPMEVGNLNLFVGSNPFRLLNNCELFSTDSITTYYPVSYNTWYFFTPMHDSKLSDIRHTANASFVFRYYNGQQRATSGIGNSWQNVNDGMLHAGQGYIFHCNANGDLIMPAVKETKDVVFATGEVTKALTAFESDNSANKNWNYVGNPYPCYYDIHYMDFTAPITIRRDNNYYAYSISDDDYVLSPMQSFFVQKPDAIDNIIFRPEGRQLSPTVNRAAYVRQLRAAEMQTRFIYNIELSSDDNTDRTRVVLNEEKSTNYDMDCDAAKFMSEDSSIPQLYTIDANGTRMAINERPRENGVMNLGVAMVAGKTYTLSSSRHDGTIYLKDNETGKTIDLTVDSYSFTADETTETTARFTVSFTENSTTDVEDAVIKDVQIIGNVGSMTIITSASCSIQVYNVYGSLEASANKTTTFNLPAGIYFVKVNGVTTKVVVR